MWTLVLNCGSSSVKFALLNPASGEVRLSGLAERLGAPEASVRLEWDGQGGHRTHALRGGGYAEAIDLVLAELDDSGAAFRSAGGGPPRRPRRQTLQRPRHHHARGAGGDPRTACRSRRCTIRPTSRGSRRHGRLSGTAAGRGVRYGLSPDHARSGLSLRRAGSVVHAATACGDTAFTASATAYVAAEAAGCWAAHSTS